MPYTVFKIQVDSVLPDALTNESDVSLSTRLGLTLASAELSVLSIDPFPCYDKSLRLTGACIIKIFATVSVCVAQIECAVL